MRRLRSQCQETPKLRKRRNYLPEDFAASSIAIFRASKLAGLNFAANVDLRMQEN
jgi:hypothetical protein